VHDFKIGVFVGVGDELAGVLLDDNESFTVFTVFGKCVGERFGGAGLGVSFFCFT
jgi:hypothetical protein